VTVKTCNRRGRGAVPSGSPIRKIRAIRGLHAIPTSVPIEGGLASHWPGAQNRGGQNGKKPPESSHWLSFAAMPGEDRESTQAQLTLSPNPGPRLVLRPEGFARAEPLRRPADPNSPGRIANPCDNRSVMGKFPSAGRPVDRNLSTDRASRRFLGTTQGLAGIGIMRITMHDWIMYKEARSSKKAPADPHPRSYYLTTASRCYRKFPIMPDQL